MSTFGRAEAILIYCRFVGIFASKLGSFEEDPGLPQFPRLRNEGPLLEDHYKNGTSEVKTVTKTFIQGHPRGLLLCVSINAKKSPSFKNWKESRQPRCLLGTR